MRLLETRGRHSSVPLREPRQPEKKLPRKAKTKCATSIVGGDGEGVGREATRRWHGLVLRRG